ncbi:hypothetical protein DITRI_Ditri10aG0155900 [Diplodiscus trichospermus]
MEKKLYDAAVEGSVSSLRNLLQEDALLLDKFIAGPNSETPLHVASTRGHVEFVDLLLACKPGLAKQLDSRDSSPLHLATAEGHLNIVRKLLQVNPDMCLVYDIYRRNPLHIAAIKGHLDVLKELVDVRPTAARLLMDEGETILHACVRYNQLKAMMYLVDVKAADHELINWKNYDGNTILHLAIAAKQTEAIHFLISSTTIDVNTQNEDGFTALDLLSQRDVKERQIVDILRRMRAIQAKDKPLSNRQLKTARNKILISSSTSYQTNAVSKPKKCFGQKEKEHKRSTDSKRLVHTDADWVERKRNTIMLVASLLATMAFQAGVNPPSGVWQDSKELSPSSSPSPESNTDSVHDAGFSVMAANFPIPYTLFVISNTVGFLASLSIILLLISGLPLRRRFFMWVLMVIMWVAISAMALTYLLSVLVLTPKDSERTKILVIVLFVWIGLMLLLLLGHTIRLIIRLIKYLGKLVIRLVNAISTHHAGA